MESSSARVKTFMQSSSARVIVAAQVNEERVESSVQSAAPKNGAAAPIFGADRGKEHPTRQHAPMGESSTRSGGDVACGPGGAYHVSRAAPTMDEKVFGIDGGWSHWMVACAECGRTLEPTIGSGWFCQTDGSPRHATGVWLKRQVTNATSAFEVDVGAPRQTIVGFGGAFTDATAYAASLLPPALRAVWLRLYFGSNSSGYTIGRVPFGGSDFSRAWLRGSTAIVSGCSPRIAAAEQQPAEAREVAPSLPLTLSTRG
jgi:hypothetical protein